MIRLEVACDQCQELFGRLERLGQKKNWHGCEEVDMGLHPILGNFAIQHGGSDQVPARPFCVAFFLRNDLEEIQVRTVLALGL